MHESEESCLVLQGLACRRAIQLAYPRAWRKRPLRWAICTRWLSNMSAFASDHLWHISGGTSRRRVWRHWRKACACAPQQHIVRQAGECSSKPQMVRRPSRSSRASHPCTGPSRPRGEYGPVFRLQQNSLSTSSVATGLLQLARTALVLTSSHGYLESRSIG